jgi:hypothetical protein
VVVEIAVSQQEEECRKKHIVRTVVRFKQAKRYNAK